MIEIAVDIDAIPAEFRHEVIEFIGDLYRKTGPHPTDACWTMKPRQSKTVSGSRFEFVFHFKKLDTVAALFKLRYV